jgi:hypothetical protein
MKPTLGLLLPSHAGSQNARTSSTSTSTSSGWHLPRSQQQLRGQLSATECQVSTCNGVCDSTLQANQYVSGVCIPCVRLHPCHYQSRK